MTRHNDTARQRACEELEFWREFAHWWETRHGAPVNPRIIEALTLAEARLNDVQRTEGPQLAYCRDRDSKSA